MLALPCKQDLRGQQAFGWRQRFCRNERQIVAGSSLYQFAASAGCSCHQRNASRFLICFEEGIFVNKTELIEHIAAEADISKAAAGRALDAAIDAIKTTLSDGGTVSVLGFGTFAVTKRPARTGRNPRTGEAIKIEAANVPRFRPGKALKDAVN